MSERFWNDNPENNEEMNTERPIGDFTAKQPSPDAAAPEQNTAAADQAPAEPEQTYEDVYSDSSAYSSHDAQSYTSPYSSSYQPAHAADQSQSNPYTEPVAAQPQQPYGDGYYHHSYVNQPSASGTSYTAPSYTPPAEPPKRQKKKRVGLTRGGVALLLVFCLLISGAAGFFGSMIAQKISADKYSATSADTMVIHKVDTEAQTAGTEALVDKTTSEITNEVADTVVEITTEVMQTNNFYGQYIAQGAGSGVIISDDGYILTNNHVIEDASSIEVTTRNGDSYKAELIGADADVDVAILKIDAKDLPAAVFGDSSTLKVGDKAVIIGNPLGTLGGSVTEGIISALDRSIVIDGKTMHLMQTDAAINPGNSGGGMFNGQGELAGIVVAKSSSSSESIDNIGFVIPINNVLDILGDLKDYGYVRGRADTGMSFINLTNQMYAWYYYNNNSAGVYISSVQLSSNAYKAGFREGDRVIAVDGQQISSADDIDSIVSKKSAGDTVSFELERNGSKGTLELTLEEKVPDSVKSDSSDKSGSDRTDPFGGFGR